MSRVAVAWVLECSPTRRHTRPATALDSAYVLAALGRVVVADLLGRGATMRCPLCHRAAPVVGLEVALPAP